MTAAIFLRAARLALAAPAVLLAAALVAETAQAGDVELVSRAHPIQASNSDSEITDMSPDGRYLVLSSWALNLAAGISDRNRTNDVFLVDQVTGKVTLVSHAAGAPGTAADGQSISGHASADGAQVIFLSNAPNLVPGQLESRSGSFDTFLWERATGAVTLLSHAAGSASQEGNGGSGGEPLISADGRFAAFVSSASDLVPGQTGPANTANVFLYDRAAGTVLLVSHRAGSAAEAVGGTLAGLSDSGRSVAFISAGMDLVPGQSGTARNAFRFDTATGEMLLASHTAASPATAGGGVERAWISGDGRSVLFSSAGTFIPGQAGAASGVDLFLWNGVSGATTLVTHAPGAPLTATGSFRYAGEKALSADGRFAGFTASTSALLPGAGSPEGSIDAFLFDSSGANGGILTLVSHLAGSPGSPAGGIPAGFYSLISSDGGSMVFTSSAPGIVPGQAGAPSILSVYRYDRATGTNTLVSHPEGAPAQAGNDSSSNGPLSADGRWVSFVSFASDLAGGAVESQGYLDVFLWDRATGSNRLISGHAPAAPSLTPEGSSIPYGQSADGRWTVFTSTANNLVSGQIDIVPDWVFTLPTEDVFLADRLTGDMVLVSHTASSPVTTSMAAASLPSISADGRWIVYESTAKNLAAGQTGASGYNVFLYDRATGANRLVSHAWSAATQSVGGEIPQISADGRFVLFSSRSPLLVAGMPAGSTGENDFLFDRISGAVSLVSHAAGSAVTPSNSGGGGYSAHLSADGRWVAFASRSTDIVPGQVSSATTVDKEFLYDRQSGSIRLVSAKAGSATVVCQSGPVSLAGDAAFSPDSAFLVYDSLCPDIVPGQVDTNGARDVFLYEIASGTSRLVSHRAGSPLTAAGGAGGRAAGGGRFVTFMSQATDLVSGVSDSNHGIDVFLWDGTTGANTLVSHVSGSLTTAGDGPTGGAQISADGRRIVMSGQAGNLVAGQTDLNGRDDVFSYDRASGVSTLLSHRPGSAAAAGNGTSFAPDGLSADGRCVFFSSSSTDLIAGDFNDFTDVFRLCDDDVRLPADLAVAVTDGPATAAPGLPVSYTLTVTNQGPGPAVGASVDDVFPDELGAVAWTCVPTGDAACTAAGAGPLHDQVSLPPGAAVTYTATGTLALTATGILSNTAHVTAPAGITDPDQGNNEATDIDFLNAVDPGGCPPAQLCLQNGRFQVSVTWRDFNGHNGLGLPRRLADESGYFTFFDATNAEVFIKVLDACRQTGSFWVFDSHLSSVEYTITVTDTQTGQKRTIFNPLRHVAPSVLGTSTVFRECGTGTTGQPRTELVDTSKLPANGTPVIHQVADPRVIGACVQDSHTMCLSHGRFRVHAMFKDPQGNGGAAKQWPLTGDAGYSTFFSDGNVELFLKVLDACSLTGSYWVFASGLTNVEVELSVEDTQTGKVWRTSNPQGRVFATTLDTKTFFTDCP